MKNFVLKNKIKQAVTDEKGITLVELLVVLAILGIVIGGVYQYYFYGYNSWVRSSVESEMIQEARLAVVRLDREVREAEKAVEGKEPVVLGSDKKTISIYTRSDSEAHPKLITYRLKNGNLERGVSLPTNDAYPYQYEAEPSQWEAVISNVEDKSIFSVPSGGGAGGFQRGIINLDLRIVPQEPVKPFNIKAVLTVRGRG